MSYVGFELHPDYQGTEIGPDGETEVPTFEGGQLALTDGSAFDVAKELESGDGLILVDEIDQATATLLRGYPALQETDVPAGYQPTTSLEQRTKRELVDMAELRGIDGAARMNKSELVDALRGDTEAEVEDETEIDTQDEQEG